MYGRSLRPTYAAPMPMTATAPVPVQQPFALPAPYEMPEEQGGMGGMGGMGGFNPGMLSMFNSGGGSGLLGGGSASAGSGSAGGGSGMMGSLGPIAAIMAAVAATKEMERAQGNSTMGKIWGTFNAPSFNQIKADPKLGFTTAAGIPFINGFIRNDKAANAKPEWQGLLGGLFGG